MPKEYIPYFKEMISSAISITPENPMKKKDVDPYIGKAKLNDYTDLYNDMVNQRGDKK